MNITIADDLLRGVGLSPHQAALELAIGLFTERRITLGRAAGIASVSQADFLKELGRRRIPIHYDVGDFEGDIKTIQRMVTS